MVIDSGRRRFVLASMTGRSDISSPPRETGAAVFPALKAGG